VMMTASVFVAGHSSHNILSNKLEDSLELRSN